MTQSESQKIQQVMCFSKQSEYWILKTVHCPEHWTLNTGHC